MCFELQSASLHAAFEHDPLLPGREYAGPAAALPYSDRHPGTWHHDPEVRQAEACGLPGCGQASIKFPLKSSTHDTIIANCSCTTRQQSSAPRGGWSGSSPSACSASCCWSSPSRALQAIRKLARNLRGGSLVRTIPRASCSLSPRRWAELYFAARWMRPPFHRRLPDPQVRLVKAHARD